MTEKSAERLSFSDFQFNRFPNGLCRAEVCLTLSDHPAYTGHSDGSGSATGVLRCAALASIAALQQAIQADVTIELLGVKGVSAFDSTIVIVSIGVRDDGRYQKLVGAYVADEGMERAAAVAVLNATNRYFANGMVARPR